MNAPIVVAAFAGFTSILLLVFFFRRGISSRRSGTETAGLSEELYQEVKNGLASLGLSGSRLAKASGLMGVLIDKEVKKSSSRIEKDYRKTLLRKDEVLGLAEKKILSLDDDNRRLFKLRKQTDTVVRSAAQGRVVVNDQGRAVMVDEAAEKILGKKKEEVVGRPLADVPGREQLVSFIDRTVESEEETLKQFAGDPEAGRLILGSSAVIENESGHTRGMISALPHKAGQREAEDYKSEFIASVTHELRAPLVCIEKSIDAVLEGAVGEVSSELKDYLAIARRNSSRLSETVSQILDFSGLQTGRLRLHTSFFPAAELAAEIRENLSAWAGDKQIELMDFAEDKSVALEADRQKIGQVLTNLVSNALKFTPRGGHVRITSETARRSEHFMPPHNRPHIRFTVQDDGPGIPAHEQQKIFEKFARASTQSTAEEAGTGLGLAIVKEIVRLHGGRIWLVSEPGRGSSFSFVIPQFPAV